MNKSYRVGNTYTAFNYVYALRNSTIVTNNKQKYKLLQGLKQMTLFDMKGTKGRKPKTPQGTPQKGTPKRSPKSPRKQASPYKLPPLAVK